MANNSAFRIDIEFDGMEELMSVLEEAGQTEKRHFTKKLNRFKSVPERGAKKLTPVLENDLTRSIRSSPVMQTNGTYFFTLGSNLPYAVKMHEWMGGWGERTQNKQRVKWRGYTPGRKYLENAVNGSEESFQKMAEELLDKFTGG